MSHPLLDSSRAPTLREVLRARGLEGAKPLSARRDMKNIIMTGVAVLSLCMAIGAMGSAAATWSLTVSPQQIDDFGPTAFAVCKAILIFYPVLYAPCIILIIRKSASIAVFLTLLEENILVVFPVTESLRYVFASNLASILAVTMLAYVAFAGALFVRCSTPFSAIVPLYKQFLFDMTLAFASIFSLDGELISLNEWLRSCDPRVAAGGGGGGDDEGKIDAVTCRAASERLRNMVVAISEAEHTTSYPKDAMQESRPAIKSSNARMRFMLLGQYAFMCLGLVAIGVYQLLADDREWSRATFESQVVPCAQVCISRTAAASNFGGAENATAAAECRSCLCDCMTMLGVSTADGAAETCASYFAVPQCARVRDQVCPRLGKDYCLM